MFGIDDAALAVMLAGGISTAGALYANKKNVDYNRESNRVNYEIARQNNATQVEMANTAHQREVRDLRAAHLNPILSAGGNGASSPSLQAPNIEPAHVDNAFNGLANSAKGVSRFLSQEYKQQMQQLALQNIGAGLQNEATAIGNEGSRIANRMDQMEFDYLTQAHDSEMDQLSADRLQGVVNKVAAMSEYGLAFRPGDDGLQHPYIASYSRFNDAVNLAREGIRSDLKQRSNANWRANLSSFVPFVSPAAVNSASSAIRGNRTTVTTRRRP